MLTVLHTCTYGTGCAFSFRILVLEFVEILHDLSQISYNAKKNAYKLAGPGLVVKVYSPGNFGNWERRIPSQGCPELQSEFKTVLEPCLKAKSGPGVAVHICSLSIQGLEAGGSRVQVHHQ